MYTMCHSKPLLSSGVERGACIIYTVDEFLKLYFFFGTKKGASTWKERKIIKVAHPGSYFWISFSITSALLLVLPRWTFPLFRKSISLP